ncbi:hypothetical protein ACFV4M_25920 [Kitasatospora indigofera]|uniref:hypothetical protein n=1 Tax=Kitasatospora indigofera TaxID=67307 RepID=UPI00365870F0
MIANATHQLLDRETAVRRIGDALADRTAFVITIPPGTASTLAGRLAPVTGWCAYLDNGTPTALATSNRKCLRAADALTPMVGVLVVPKTVPATQLSAVVGQPIPADGSQDVVVLTSPSHVGSPVFWPLLFVDAVTRVDPRLAAQLRTAPRDSGSSNSSEGLNP